MPRPNRNLLAVVYSALIFGTLLSPYVYIAGGALTYFSATAAFIAIFGLLLSTVLLLLIFISQTKLEDKIASKFFRTSPTARVINVSNSRHDHHPIVANRPWPFRKYGHFLIALSVVAAMYTTYYIESKIANFTLLTEAEYSYYLILISGTASAVAFVVIAVTHPSRLERVLTSLFSPVNRFYLPCSFVAFLTILALVVVAGYKLYEYYLEKHPPVY